MCILKNKNWSSIALFGTTNRVPRPSRSIKLHLKLSQKRVNNNNCNNKPFCKTWSCLRRPFTKWSKKYKNDIIKIQNDIIACLVKFIRKKTKEDILEYYTTVSDKGIHQFSCKKNCCILTFCNLPKWSSSNTWDVLWLPAD